LNNNVLIVHSCDWLGIARLPEVLRAGGARVTVMAPRGSLILATKHAEEKLTIPSAMEDIVAALRVHLLERSYALVIIADDPLLNALAERAPQEPWIAAILPMRDPNSLKMLVSKIAFLDRCREIGLPIAPSGNVTTTDDALRVSTALGYPVMLKRPTGSSGSGVKRIDTADEMRREFASFAATELVTVERFVEGRICGCETLFDRGRPVCWSPFFKVHCYPEFGPSAVRMMYAHPALENIVQKLGAMTGFHGFATFCFIHDERRDELVLLELNFRPGTGMHIPGTIQAMFANGIASLLQGRQSTGPQTHGRHGDIVSLFPQDFERILGQKDYGCLGRSMLRGGFLRDVPFTDLPLLSSELLLLAYGWLPEPWKRIALAANRGLKRIARFVLRSRQRFVSDGH
jgi:hypothetical protein